MTNTTGGSTPAGWYPVAPGSSQLRWWDGSAWTDQVHDQAVAQPTYGEVPKAPAGTNPNTVWMWILAVSPIISVLAIFTWDVNRYMSVVTNSEGTLNPGAQFSAYAETGYYTYLGLGFLTYLLIVLVAAFDWIQLRKRGVPRPFHWAWAFLGSIVYVIGRSVVVHRRTGRGLAPLWVWIAATVVATIISVTVVVSAVASVASTIPFSN